jgi:hypothetical protein
MLIARTRVLLILALLVCACFASVFLPGCKKNNGGSSGSAKVMFVNAYPGASVITGKVNNSTVSGTDKTPYLSNTVYQNVVANTNIDLGIYSSSSNALLGSGNTNLTTNAHYSAFICGIVKTGPTFVLTNDDLTTPTSGDAAVRFINLSDDSLSESFFVGGKKLDSSIGYTICTAFYPITATTGSPVLAQDPSYAEPEYMVQLASQSFYEGKKYTIMLTGSYRFPSSSSAGLRLTVINNN